MRGVIASCIPISRGSANAFLLVVAWWALDERNGSFGSGCDTEVDADADDTAMKARRGRNENLMTPRCLLLLLLLFDDAIFSEFLLSSGNTS